MSGDGDLEVRLGRGPVSRADGEPSRHLVLTINGGSSSLKFGVFAPADPVELVGLGESRLIVGSGAGREERSVESPDQDAAAVDQARNAAGEPLISTSDSGVRVRVIPTDEESTIARQAIRLGLGPAAPNGPALHETTADVLQGADRWTRR